MSETTPAMTTTPTTPTMPALPAGWIALACPKCGADFHVRPADDRGMQALRALGVDDDINDWQSGPACPLCAHGRGGDYPLVRKLQEGERAALTAHQAATLAAHLAVEPLVPPEGCSEAVNIAWIAAADEFDRLMLAPDHTANALRTFGYSDDECVLIGDTAIDIHERDTRAAAKAAS